MGKWAFTTYEQDESGKWTITEHHANDRAPKHGVHGVRLSLDGASEHKQIVYIHDNSPHGLDALTMRKIAERAINTPLFWSDERCVYWFYDFELWGHWCELLPHSEFCEPLEINVYS